MRLSKILTAAGATGSFAAIYSHYPDCQDLIFLLPINSTGIVAPATPATIDFNINETYAINGRYCLPTKKVAGTADTLQLLVHGITYNRNYWSGYDLPGFHGTNYSWISYAAERGYPSLSIDRLGHGLSDHPDPISIVQNQPQVDLMHALVTQIKRGTTLPRQYSRIIYAGHSQGSLIGKAYTDQHPNDIDALILTGWTTLPLSGSLVFPGLTTAASAHQRFSDLEPGYLTGINASARAPFYSTPGADYDPRILAYDFKREDIVTIGTLFTNLNQTMKSNFTGPVFVLTGELDRIFCGPSGNCNTSNGSVLAQQGLYFPKVGNFSYFSPENTGHDWNLHYTQDVSFERVFDWLVGVGFGASWRDCSKCD